LPGPLASLRTEWDKRADEWRSQAEDPVDHYSRRARHVALFIRDRVPICRSLGVGCGPGLLVSHLLEYGYDAYGCDISEGMVEAARATISGIVDNPNDRVRLVTTPDMLPFDDDFGLVVAIGVFAFVPDGEAFARLLSGKVQEGGYLCAESTNRLRFNLAVYRHVARRFWRGKFWAVRNLLRAGIWRGGRYGLANARECRPAGSFDRLFERHGYVRCAAFGLYRIPRLDRDPLARGRLGRFLVRRFGWNYIAIYRKKTPAAFE
jgi:SAM-dependent methyltransferase